MSESLLDILSGSNKDIDNQKLMDYLSGKLDGAARHEVEKWMIDHPFFDEAVEGLQQAGDVKRVQSSVDHINRQLALYLEKKRGRKSRRKRVSNRWALLAVVMVLILAVLVYLVISRL